MRSVRIERAPRGNPRAQTGRNAARATRKPAVPPAGRSRRRDDDGDVPLRARLLAPFTHPLAVMTGLFLAFALIAALFAGGYVGRAIRRVDNGISAAIAHAGFGISEIHIAGLRRTPNAGIVAALGMEPGQSIFSADLKGAQARLSRLPWVASVDVMRRYPDAIFVTVVEKRPFALWKSPEGVVVVERSGAVITGEDIEQFRRLPKLVGAGAPEAAAELVDAVQAHRAVCARIAAYARQSERRWNLILDDGVVVKLPESGWQKELDTLERLIVDAGILERDVTEIDLRSPTHYFFVLKGGEKKDVTREKET